MVLDPAITRRHTALVTILVISENEERLNLYKEALQRAEFRIVSTRSVGDGWAKLDYFDMTAVVIDADLSNDITASAFRQRFITLSVQPEATSEALAIELAQVLRGGSALVQ